MPRATTRSATSANIDEQFSKGQQSWDYIAIRKVADHRFSPSPSPSSPDRPTGGRSPARPPATRGLAVVPRTDVHADAVRVAKRS